MRRFVATLAAVLVPTALAAGCGEKEEPSAAELERDATAIEEEAVAEVDPGFIKGTWAGTLRQQGLEPFKVRAQIRGYGRRKSLVSYTGIACAGTWTPRPSASETAFVFREVIDRGKGGKCKGTGTVTLTPVGERVLYEFSGGGVESRGRLRRVE